MMTEVLFEALCIVCLTSVIVLVGGGTIYTMGIVVKSLIDEWKE